MKVLSVAGYHRTGKTTLVVELIKELKRRGYKVASIKDIHSENFSMDKEGSNSWKHWEASNDTVFARSLNETYQIWHHRLELNGMLEHLSADYVIVEGIKSAALPRILCAKSEDQLEELINGTVFAVSGKWADHHTEYNGLPVLKSTDEITAIADLVEEKVFDVLPLAKPDSCMKCGYNCYKMVGEILAGRKTREDCKTDRKLSIQLKVNGKEVKLMSFIQNILKDTILGFIRNLKGCEKGNIEIIIND